jgi:hypothetical protein
LETPETRETSVIHFGDTDVRTTILKQYVFFINLIRLRNVYSFIELISLLNENGKCVLIGASSFTNSLSFYYLLLAVTIIQIKIYSCKCNHIASSP